MGKCADCGFLSLRNDYTGELDQVYEDYRSTGSAPHRLKPNPPKIVDLGAGESVTSSHYYEEPYTNIPICFARSVDLPREVPTSEDDLHVLEVLQRERGTCSENFTRWRQGFTPKEHQEMLDRQWMIEREDMLTDEMRDREDRRDAKQAEQHAQQMNTLKSHHWRELAVFGGVIGLATVIAGILDGAIGRGWTPWPF